MHFNGFRHLAQFAAARAFIGRRVPFGQDCQYTAVVPSGCFGGLLEKPDRASEAELLVAAFRNETPSRSLPVQPSRRTTSNKPPSSVATGMGMVDVMHEMREMEQRVHRQLKDLQDRVHSMLDVCHAWQRLTGASAAH
jgi:hypothetical protein